MAEYIEREAVMQKFADHVKRSNNSDFAPVPTWNQAVQIVEDFPAADAIEELTGLVQEAERDRDEYRERLDKANDAIEELQKRVPKVPHGRLIEKGALLGKCYQHFEDYMFGKIDGKTALLNIEKEIKAAPTIIPAELEEEGE